VPARTLRNRRIGAIGGAALIVALAIAVLGGGGSLRPPPAAGVFGGAAAGDPFAYAAGRQNAFAARAAAGSAQVLFTKSPGGIIATAARVASYRRLIDAAVRGTDFSAAMLEGLVFLESAGRPEVIAGSDPSAAAGLTQILAGTGQSLLGMQIALGRSRSLTTAITAALNAGQSARAARLERRRSAIDDRFDPAKELAATVRYLEIAQRDLGRVDLAVAAYHAGIGNIQNVLRDYDGGGAVPYAQLYFDIGPERHAAAWQLLSSLGDDSSLYYWRVLAAEQIMSLYRSDRPALVRLNGLETGYPSSALVLVPPPASSGTGAVRFGDPAALSAAFSARRLVPLPRNAAALYLSYSPAIGSLARRLGAPAALYRGLRPAALSILVEIAALVHRLSGVAAPLTVTRTVLDAGYDRLLGFDDPPATTGYSFQIARRYASGAQARAFQFVLDRLQALNLIAWVRGTSAIEITVAPDAGSVLRHGV
jgi:hypothetical protein